MNTHYHQSTIVNMNSNLYLLCVRCKKMARFVCERCSDPYCTKPCQIMDWPSHKKICFPMPSLVEISSEMDMLSVHDTRGNGTLALTDAAVSLEDDTIKDLAFAIQPKLTKSNDSQPKESKDLADRNEEKNLLINGLEQLMSNDPKSWQLSFLINDDVLVTIVHVDEIPTTNCWAVQSQYFSKTKHMQYELKRLHCNNEVAGSQKIMTNEVYAIEYKDTYYRGVCLYRSSTKEVLVQLIDVGQTLQIPIHTIKVLDPRFKYINAFAFEVYLDKPENIVVGQILRTNRSAVNSAGVMNVKMVEPIDEKIVSSCKRSKKDETMPIPAGTTEEQEDEIISSSSHNNHIDTIPLPADGPIEMFCLDYSNIENGYISACVHDPEKIKSINKMSDDISNYLLTEGIAGAYSPKLDETCFAYHDFDHQWYRAECIAVKGLDSFKVIFIDYGCTRTVRSLNLRKFSIKFNQPAIMHFCCIQGVPPKPSNKLIQQMTKFFNEHPFFTIMSTKYDNGLTMVECPELMKAIK